MLAEVNTTFVWNVVLTRADWSTSPYWQAGNSLNQFKNGWGRLTIRCFSISFNVNFRHLRRVFGLGRPLSEDFTGVTTSSRRYLWRRHLGFKMAAPEMTSTKTWGGLFGPHWGGGAIWRPFRFRPPSWMTSFPGPENWEWGHPRWRPEAEGPPYCASASMGTEKAALYYSRNTKDGFVALKYSPQNIPIDQHSFYTYIAFILNPYYKCQNTYMSRSRYYTGRTLQMVTLWETSILFKRRRNH